MSNGKKYLISQVWENIVGHRRQDLAPWTMSPPGISEAVMYTRWPCPKPSWLAEPMSRSSVYRRTSWFLSACCNEKEQIAPPATVKKRGKNKPFSPYPKAAVRGYFRLFFESDVFPRKRNEFQFPLSYVLMLQK